jgi:hypothetical protein
MTSYLLTSRDVSLADGHVLEATCRKKDGSWVNSSLDLNTCVGNNNGKHPFPELPALLQFGLLAKKPEPFPCVLLLCVLAPKLRISTNRYLSYLVKAISFFGS